MKKQNSPQDSFFVMQSHCHYNLIILATGLLIFLFVPLFFLTSGQSKQFFNNGRELQVITDICMLIGVFYLSVAAVYWGLALLKRNDLAAGLVRFLFSWIVLTGFLFPLSANHGMFELLSAPLHKTNFVLALSMSTVLAVLLGSKYVKTVIVFLVTFLAIAILPTLPRAVSQFEKQTGESDQLQLSADSNLLFIGLDGVPGHVVADLLIQNPTLENEFKDFTFYTNVGSTSPATDGALMGMVYGNHDFSRWGDPYPINWRELFFNNADKFNFYTGYKFNRYNDTGTKLSAGRYGVDEQRNELFEMYRNVAVRLFSKLGINSLHRIFDKFFPDQQGNMFWTTKGYDRVLDTLTLGSVRPTIFYSHFAFTHWPTSLDENCIDRRKDKNWMSTHQNKKGIIAGAKCGLDKYTELLDKLKSLAVYDNTTIVFYSDHGKPALYYDEPPHNYHINDNREFGVDRYKPFLMIKPASAKNSQMAYSDKIVLIDDLAQTACYKMGPSNECEKMPGLNILDETDVAPEDFYIHVVKDFASSWLLADHKGVKLSRKIPLETAMRESSEIVLSVPDCDVGECFSQEYP